MNRSVSLVAFVAFILLGSAAHSPAPIIEPSQTPSDKRKPAEQKSAATSAGEVRQSRFDPFVGVWLGNVVTETVDNNTTASKNASTKPGGFVISKDGNVRWGSSGHHAKALLSSDNHELHWSYQNFDEHGDVRWNCTLRLSDPKTANYHGNGSSTNAFGNITMTSSATMTKK